jgi:glycosyltransferase involved in cell wall biosynthesis
MPRVLIVHPWLPQYRTPFFGRLRQRLEDDGVELSVAVGAPPKAVEARQDGASEDWIRRLPSREHSPFGRSLVLRRLPALDQFDLVILEQAIGNFENYGPLLRRTNSQIALWGHGKTYTHHVTRTERYLKTFLTNRADWFFAYTQGGADYVRRHGFPKQRTTIVQNAVDTQELQRGMASVDAACRDNLFLQLGLDAVAQVGLFVGGLDEPKRIPFLLQAAALVARRRPNFVLLVAGDGSHRKYIDEKLGERWLRYVGQTRGEDLGRIATVAQAMICPGRVGLNAVDSFALSLPLVTTQWPFHAPEFEYLDDENSIVARDDLDDFVDKVDSLLRDPSVRDSLVSGCVKSASVYTLERMVENFAGGIQLCLSRGR